MKPLMSRFSLGSGGATRREDFVIFSSVTLSYTGFAASFPFLAVYLLNVRGVPEIQVALLYLVSGVLGILGQIIGGRFSDVLGTKSMVSLGLIVSGGFFGIISVFIISNSPAILLIISYPVLSLFNNLSQLAISSHISDRPKSQMAGGMSLLYSGTNLGFTIGPVSGGYLIAYLGYSSIFTFGLATTFASAVVIIAGIKRNPRYAMRGASGNRPVKSNVKLTPSLFTFLVLVLVSWFAIAFQAIPLTVYETSYLSLSSIGVGIVLSTNGLLITVLQVPISNLIGIERRLRFAPIALGSVLMGAGFAAIAYSRNLYGLIVAITLTTIGEIMIAVPTQVVITMFSREYNRGTFQGYYFAFSRMGIAISSASWLPIFAIFLPHVYLAWILMAAISVAAAISYQVLNSPIQREFSKLGDEQPSES